MKKSIYCMVIVGIAFLAQTLSAELIEIQGMDALNNALSQAKNNKRVVMMIHATWCGPCKATKPCVYELEKEMNDVVFLLVDGDKNGAIRDKYLKSGYPTFVIFDIQGVKVDTFCGGQSKEGLRSKIMDSQTASTKGVDPRTPVMPVEKPMTEMPQLPQTTTTIKEVDRRAPQMQMPAKKIAAPMPEIPQLPPQTTTKIPQTATSTGVIAIKDHAELVQELAKGKLVVVNFSAIWCSPCKEIEPLIAQLAKENPEISFLYVDADIMPIAMKNYGIKGYPTLILFDKTGKEYTRLRGGCSEDLIRRTVKNLKMKESMPTPAPSVQIIDSPAAATRKSLPKIVDESYMMTRPVMEEPIKPIQRQEVKKGKESRRERVSRKRR